jgi:hypothetical protein
MTVITNAENLYGDLFYHVVNRGERFFSDDDQQIFRGLQSVIGATKYHGATPQTVDNFLMGGVTNASSDIWGAYLALNHEHHKQFGEPMKPEDFQSVAEDLSRIFLKLSSLQFDTLLALMLAQKGERGVSHTISQHNAEADVERYRRMLKLHKKEEGLHVDIDLEYLESFNKDLNTFPPAGEKRFGCPARSISVTKEDGTVNPVIPDLVEFYAEIASITLPPVAEKLKEALDFYDDNRARFMGGGAFSDPLLDLP